MQTTNHSLAPFIILTNHAPPISSPNQPLAFHANVGSQLYTFPNPLDNAHVKLFLYSILLAPTITYD
jgi:hypothetical protein